MAGFVDGLQLAKDVALGNDAGGKLRIGRAGLVFVEPNLVGVVVLRYKFAKVSRRPQPRSEFQPRSRGLFVRRGTLQLKGTDNLTLAKQLRIADQGAVRGT